MIWLVGDKGMMGRELAGRLWAAGHAFIGSDSEVDIRSPDLLREFAAGKQIDWIVNCAAYTAVDRAEEEENLAASLNASGPRNLAIFAASIGARIIHISTDYVFDGRESRPYVEDDPINPLGVYGRTKAEGEKAILVGCPSSYIIRTAWLYGRYGSNFVTTMLKLMSEQEVVRVVADQFGTPTWARNLADAILSMVTRGGGDWGVYHYTDAGTTNWYSFAVAIRDEAQAIGILGPNCEVTPILTSEYPTKARRPFYSVLSKDKIMSVMGIKPPAWREALRHYLVSIKKQ